MVDVEERDNLTGLMSLSRFHAAIDERLAAGAVPTGDDALAVVYFNIQNFKFYNERFGYKAGDELLTLVAVAILKAFPDSPAARFSSDQFAVVARNAGVVDGIGQVRAAFRKHHKDSSIWLKAGYCIIEPTDDRAGVICDRAKIACDAIKGRRDVYFRKYDEELKNQIMLHRYVLDHFDEALEKHWIKIFYQPIARVATGEICDEEALARWVDPIEGLIAPADFIPVLEDARLVHRLDLYMVRRACENFARIREDGFELVPVSINLSRLDFELCDIVKEVEDILDEFGVPRSMIAIEITESALAGNEEFLKSEIDRFRADGFEVWMDDFGSGYSSLHLLKGYAFDLVKLDMGFLKDFAENEQTRVMLAHIISMSKELGLKTLVEGVETAEQFEFLKTIGCGRAQGFYLGRPESLHDVEVDAAAHVYPAIEHTDSHDFYEAVGRVNLMRPEPLPPIGGHYVPGDAAAAILNRKDGVYEYFNISDAFRIHLSHMGTPTVEEATADMNDPTCAIHRCFERAISHFTDVGDWVDAQFTTNGYTCYMHIKLIARYHETDALALLAVANDMAQDAHFDIS